MSNPAVAEVCLGRSHLCVFQAIGQWQSAVEMLQTIGFELVMHSKTGAYVTVRVD